MMHPRLKLARNLLTDDGVIFISIDDNEQSNLKKLCDEIFGEENFICNFIWRKKTGASDSKDISTITEYILTYVKSKHNLENIFTKNKESYDPKRYRFKDEYFERRGPYYPDNLDRGGIRYSDSLNYPIECPDGSITYPNGRTKFENDGWIWTWGKDKFEWGLKNGFIEFKKSNKKESGWGVYYKNYVNVNNKDELTERSAPHKNIIMDIINTDGSAEIKKLFDSKVFSYPKPSNLIKQLFTYVNNCNLVLDFFSGSGTTADAVMKYNAETNSNCKYILVQIPEEIDKNSTTFKEGYKNCRVGNVPAGEMDNFVLEQLANIVKSPKILSGLIEEAKIQRPDISDIQIINKLGDGKDFIHRISPMVQRQLIEFLIKKVRVNTDRIKIIYTDTAVDLMDTDMRDKLFPNNIDGQENEIMYHVELHKKRGSVKIFAPETYKPDLYNPLYLALIKAFKWQELMKTEHIIIEEVAEREKLSREYVGKIMKMTYLAPDIVAAIVDGSYPKTLSVNKIVESEIPTLWTEQRIKYGFA